jgi:hypothetical protein
MNANVRRRPRRQRAAPSGYATAREIAQNEKTALSTVYYWLKAGKLGPTHRWRGVLVVRAKDADEFLRAVRPIEPAGGEGGAS